MAETIQQKAERLLVQGRLTVEQVGPGLSIIAKCRGDSGDVYALGYKLSENRWGCTCEASAKFRRECSHLKALKLVTVKPKGGRDEPDASAAAAGRA